MPGSLSFSLIFSFWGLYHEGHCSSIGGLDFPRTIHDSLDKAACGVNAAAARRRSHGERSGRAQGAPEPCSLAATGSLTVALKHPRIHTGGLSGCWGLRAGQAHYQRPLALGGQRIPTAAAWQGGSPYLPLVPFQLHHCPSSGEVRAHRGQPPGPAKGGEKPANVRKAEVWVPPRSCPRGPRPRPSQPCRGRCELCRHGPHAWCSGRAPKGLPPAGAHPTTTP